LLERVRLELAQAEGVREVDIQVVLTGGLSGAPWARDLPGVDATDSDLTLKGLAILWTLASGVEGVPGLDPAAWSGSAAASIHIVPDTAK
jgi:hypothetical protein